MIYRIFPFLVFFSALLLQQTLFANNGNKYGNSGKNGNGQSVTATGQAGAKILQVMTTAQTAALNFGEIVPATTAGTVTIGANGTVSSTTNQLIPNSGAQISINYKSFW